MRRESCPGKLNEARILVVDDEPDNIDLLLRLLRGEGYDRVASTTDPRQAVEVFLGFEPDLVLLDLHMPHMDGFEIIERLEPCIPPEEYLPVLVLTGDPDPDVRRRALEAGARDFLTKPLRPPEVMLRIKNLLETRFLHRQLRDQNDLLEEMVRERTRELAEAQVEILHRLARAAEYRDDITGQHAERVGALSALLAQRLGLRPDRVKLIRRAAPLHDVGKIGIPDAILMKPGPLTDAEYEVMKSHTTIGGRILSGSRFPLLEVARTIALSHHEKWDGSGYSPGLSGPAIPLEGRIVAVADVFDSLTHERPYKPAATVEEAVREIRSERGRHFDPAVVDAFMELVDGGLLQRIDPEMPPARTLRRRPPHVPVADILPIAPGTAPAVAWAH